LRTSAAGNAERGEWWRTIGAVRAGVLARMGCFRGGLEWIHGEDRTIRRRRMLCDPRCLRRADQGAVDAVTVKRCKTAKLLQLLAKFRESELMLIVESWAGSEVRRAVARAV